MTKKIGNIVLSILLYVALINILTFPCVTRAKEIINKLKIQTSNNVIFIGESQYFQVIIESDNDNDNALKWSSSDNNIAIVDSYGNVTGVNTGNAVITVESMYNPNTKDSIIIHVVNSYAYAVLTENYDLVFLRSFDKYETDGEYSIIDINGKQYSGYVFHGVEGGKGDWYKKRELIRKAYVADGNTIYPQYMVGWFCDCINLEQFEGYGFDTSNNVSFGGMFQNCTKLRNVNINDFDTSKATSMSMMFYNCESLEMLDLSSFDTSFVDSMAWMFVNCSSLYDVDLSSFVTTNVTDMSLMFSGCESIVSLNLRGFDTQNVVDMKSMFGGCSSLSYLDLSMFDTSKVTNMSSMFSGCNNLVSLDLSSFNTESVRDMSDMFYECSNLISLDLSNFNAGNVTSMSDMFGGCKNMESLELNNFDTKNVTNMYSMFGRCNSLSYLDLSMFDTSKVTDMSSMFSNCVSLVSLNLKGFDTRNVVNMRFMFDGCDSLSHLDLSSFDTSKVTDMSGMFRGCSSILSLELSNFDTKNVTNMDELFSQCSSMINVDVSSFNTESVIYMINMFSGCRNLILLDLSSFDTKNVANMSYMFASCDKLNSINIENFDTNYAEQSNWVFGGIPLQEIYVGKDFTFWNQYRYGIPYGPWTNGSIIKTANELANEYRENAEQWAGRWYLADLNQAYYVGTSLDLDGIINMNFYFKVPEEYEGAYAVLKDEMGNRTEVDLSTVPYSDKNGYKVTYPNIVAKRMMMKIELTVYDKDGNVIPMERKGSLLPNGTFSYCVTDYVNDVLMTSSRAYSKDLAYAILNYGQCAQEYFGYETDKPMPNPLGYLGSEMGEVEADPQYTQTGPEWDQYIGASLDLEGAISSYLYFRVPITATMVKSNGEESALPVVQNANGYRVEIRNIAAKRLHEMYTIRVKYEGKTYEYRTGVFSYVNRVLIPKPEANKSNLGKAFYLYNKAARLYFNY